MSREKRITQLMTDNFKSIHLQVENESHKHHVPEGSETHFKILLVSEAFQGMSMINRHRQVNALLAKELETGLHALSLHLYTIDEWDKRNKTTQVSPACRDGYRHG
ncbi:BolA family protein [Legionella jamestowniensis]|uniref:BolA family transcriptional regulator n=1 Tax=Legionella jamestowniensis TaxID=455 RepID=A0A0W0UGP1_9GAMM|nr:BolA/IbaG family iron-sulfur metabolism protein [Legionella jamestowniensis]KTD07054.1 regulator of penicillin binding proteins and beta lactamase transcription (morphogene) [Legionella jamestowniensis]OCH97649.1 BolA family transcriptional regulator [Legionella jamestowniensis]SFM03183.1 transcriptional regulator, BolA protein family [Legionella jamestowniensis DSM 19215]